VQKYKNIRLVRHFFRTFAAVFSEDETFFFLLIDETTTSFVTIT